LINFRDENVLSSSTLPRIVVIAISAKCMNSLSFEKRRPQLPHKVHIIRWFKHLIGVGLHGHFEQAGLKVELVSIKGLSNLSRHLL
jgi:hypothetical protein